MVILGLYGLYKAAHAANIFLSRFGLRAELAFFLARDPF
jgi:hypothetical protein